MSCLFHFIYIYIYIYIKKYLYNKLSLFKLIMSVKIMFKLHVLDFRKNHDSTYRKFPK